MHPYASLQYASAFVSAQPIWLPGLGTHVLKRPIPGTELHDAMGPYPVTPLAQEANLQADREVLTAHGVVSLVWVTDVLAQPSQDSLRRQFGLCRPYKTHYVHDWRLPNADYSKHHRDRIRRARKSSRTRVFALADNLDSWMDCYQTLVQRKGIRGIQDFPRSYFERVAAMPQATVIGAFVEDRLVSAHIWMAHEGRLYAHLAASTDLGYKLRSSFLIYDHAVQAFPRHIIDFGGGAGVEASGTDGLADFKKGFANDSKVNFLCGEVINPEVYDALCTQKGVTGGTPFFPAYRAPQPTPAPTGDTNP